MINHNHIIIKNIKEQTFNFENYLDITKTIYIKNCSNLKIIVNNKINKIIIEKSNKIILSICDLISGLEINNSKDILLEYSTEPNNIPIIELDKSTLFLLGSIDNYLHILINSYKSTIYNIY